MDYKNKRFKNSLHTKDTVYLKTNIKWKWKEGKDIPCKSWSKENKGHYTYKRQRRS